MGGLAEGANPTKRFPSLFGKFSEPKSVKRGQSAGTQGNASTMVLRLKSPGADGDTVGESNGHLLSDILTNEPVFDMLQGKPLVLQAEMSVEKRNADGSPKTMTISGLVPVTLSRGERNGKPTRELRLRGHLRRKRSKDVRLPYDDSSLKSDGFTSRKEIPSERRPGPPEESKLLQKSSKVYERYRTLSNISTKSKRDHARPQTDGEVADSGDDDLEPSRIENWSPLFDFSSPMSGPTGRDRARALSDWTPTPRFDLNLLQDDGAEERSKEKVKDTRKKEKSKYKKTSHNPKDLYKILDRTFDHRSDSSDQDGHDKCSAKACSKDKQRETRDTGSQTSDPFKNTEANRVHSSTQTDAHRESGPDMLSRYHKRPNLLSTEEIQQKLAKGLNESKQMLSAVHEKAANKFAEVHGKIQDAIHKRAGGRHAEHQGRNIPYHPDGYQQEHEHHEKSIHKDKFSREGFEKDVGYHQKYDESPHKNVSTILGGVRSKFHPEETVNDSVQDGHNQKHEERKHNHRDECRKRFEKDLASHPKYDDNPHKGGNVLDRLRDKFLPGGTFEDSARDEVPRRLPSPRENPQDLQNLRYNTVRGYYFEPPNDEPQGEDSNLKSSGSDIESVKKSLNMTRHGSAYPHEIQEAKQQILRKSQNIGLNDGNDRKPNGRTSSPNRKRPGNLRESLERMRSEISDKLGKTAAKTMNPIATITVSRSHTRLYNYSDGYTYTEKSGKQIVVIEAPKGMLFAAQS